jgi:hypothetical protein
MSEIVKSDLYLLRDEMVFYDKDERKIVISLKSNKIKYLNKHNYGLEVDMGKENYILRYLDNEVLFIALKRIYKKNVKKRHSNKTREFNLHRDLTREFKIK